MRQASSRALAERRTYTATDELAVVGTVNTLVSRELCETDERVHICSEVSVFTTRKQVASAWTEVLDAGHRKALCRIAIYEWVKNRVAIRLARNSAGTSVAT